MNVWTGQLETSCARDNTDTFSWCFTKTDSEGHFLGFWGQCLPGCQGQTPAPDSHFNLARLGEGGMWGQQFYLFMTWAPGFCVTYNPPKVRGSY